MSFHHYTYFIILAASLAIPISLSFDKKVAFYRQWKFLFPAMILPAAFYIAWDVLFTKWGVWSFNPDYITGIHLINLPVEEVLFFFIVPYCCLFIYACIRSYFPHIKESRLSRNILISIGIILFITGLFFYNRVYTSFTFILCGLFIGIIFLAKDFFRHFNTAAFLVSYVVILIPFLVVNGFLTAIPVVQYNDAENLGIRMYTIPLEDTFYGMLLVMMVVAGYERLKNNSSPSPEK